MLNPVIFLGVAIVIVVVVLFILSYVNKKRTPVPEEVVEQRPRGAPILRGEGAEAPRRAHRNVRARMRAAAARQEEEDDEDEEEVDLLADEIVMPDGKVGTKKRKKLEMKAEKRRERERELEEREDRKQRQLELDEKRRKEELLEKELERKQEEAERILKEEQEKRELEEYLKLKEAFAVEEEGFDEEEIDQEGHKFQEFIDYIKTEKVVLLEDLASHFKLKTQDCIDRVQDLLVQEWLTGVIDDRGKFVYITSEELESVAQFIRQRGRVSISELVDCSNTLINLSPEVAPIAM